jgi:hypothetical protein
MSQAELERELNNGAEPLLLVEKKLIAWSLGIGVVSLMILVILNHFVPIAISRQAPVRECEAAIDGNGFRMPFTTVFRTARRHDRGSPPPTASTAGFRDLQQARWP